MSAFSMTKNPLLQIVVNLPQGTSHSMAPIQHNPLTQPCSIWAMPLFIHPIMTERKVCLMKLVPPWRRVIFQKSVTFCFS